MRQQGEVLSVMSVVRSVVRSVQGEVNSAADEPEVILLWQRLPCVL